MYHRSSFWVLLGRSGKEKKKKSCDLAAQSILSHAKTAQNCCDNNRNKHKKVFRELKKVGGLSVKIAQILNSL